MTRSLFSIRNVRIIAGASKVMRRRASMIPGSLRKAFYRIMLEVKSPNPEEWQSGPELREKLIAGKERLYFDRSMTKIMTRSHDGHGITRIQGFI